MSASGRKQTVVIAQFPLVERPLLVKADVEPGTREFGLANDCFTPVTSTGRCNISLSSARV